MGIRQDDHTQHKPIHPQHNSPAKHCYSMQESASCRKNICRHIIINYCFIYWCQQIDDDLYQTVDSVGYCWSVNVCLRMESWEVHCWVSCQSWTAVESWSCVGSRYTPLVYLLWVSDAAPKWPPSAKQDMKSNLIESHTIRNLWLQCIFPNV